MTLLGHLRNIAIAVLVLCAIPGGANALLLTANLDGVSENPSSGSPATGTVQVTIDSVSHTMEVFVTFAGLFGTTTAAHIHCCVVAPGNVGVATQVPTFVGFPLGVTSGSYDHTFDLTALTSYNPSFVTASGGTAASAEGALLAGLVDGLAYFNIHTSLFPSGEIRGFLQVAQAVPEPSSFDMFGIGLVGIGLLAARRKTANR